MIQTVISRQLSFPAPSNPVKGLGQLHTVGDTGFPVNVVQMLVQGGFTDIERLGHLLVALAAVDQAGHLRFPLGEPVPESCFSGFRWSSRE